MSHSTARERLRGILQGNRCVGMASVYDPVTVRIAEEIGAEVGLMGGSLASLAVLGAPDLILISITELAEQVRRCTRACGLPLVVDGDHGYGNALNVMRTIAELDVAGCAAVSIEDTVLPRAFGSSDKPELLPIAEGVSKLKAAVAARGETGPLVLARSSAPALTGIEDAVARFTAYEAAGADALMIPAVSSRGDLERIAAATRLPLVVGGMPADMCDPAYLASMRARLWSSGHQTVNVGIQALYDAMAAVHAGTLAPALPGIAGGKLMRIVSDADSYEARLRAFVAPADATAP